MPFYDLICEKCGAAFNIRASISDKTERRIACPECASRDVKSDFKAAPFYNKGGKAPECPNSHICGAGCRHSF